VLLACFRGGFVLKLGRQLLASPPWEVRANTPALQAVAWTTLLPPPAGADAPSAAAKSAPTSLIIAAAGRPETESTVQAVFWQPSARGRFDFCVFV